MVLALGLCGLCVFQWLREGRLIADLGKTNDQLYQKREAIQGLEASIRRYQAEIQRLEKIREDLNLTIVTNKSQINELSNYAEKLEKENDAQKQLIGNYKEAMTVANERITRQNEDILKQNETIKAIVQQRDDKVAELTKMVGEYNKLVTDYNKVVEDMNKLVERAKAEGWIKDKEEPPPDPKKDPKKDQKKK
jgi:chromosome segregation ATPase